jgi:hypothetical protein|tara:strand:- start:1948 stop:2229 length:282 start_codon:yes stop_codon:yes gene_type:complete
MNMESLMEWAEEEETSSVQADKSYTQLETVQHMLLERIEGVCNTELLKIYIPRGSALIWTLRHEHGWDIDTLECDLHEHKNRQVKYVYNGRKY